MIDPVRLAKVVRKETKRLFHKSIPYWTPLKGAHVLMTGCSGPFGLWLLGLIDYANQELDLKMRTCVLTRNAGKFFANYPHLEFMGGLQTIEDDVRSFKLGAFNPSHVVHGATTSASETYLGAKSLERFDTLVSGTQRVFSVLPSSSVRSVLFLSSGVVYGALPEEMTTIPEHHSIAPYPHDISSALGHAKRAAEFLCHAHASELGISLRVARCFSFSGAGLPLDLHYAIGDFVRQAKFKGAIEIMGTGEALRSYLHFSDLAIWLIALLSDEDRSKPPTVNVGSSQSISIFDLAKTVGNRTQKPIKVSVLGAKDYAVGNPVRNIYVPNTTLSSAFGLEQWTSLETSIDTMYQTLNPS